MNPKKVCMGLKEIYPVIILVIALIFLTTCFLFGYFIIGLLNEYITNELFSPKTDIRILIGFLGLPFAISFLMFYILEHISHTNDNFADAPIYIKFFYIIFSVFLVIFSCLSISIFFGLVESAIELKGFYEIVILVLKPLMQVFIVLAILYPALRKVNILK